MKSIKKGGMCSKHYQRVLRCGDPFKARTYGVIKKCKFCNGKHCAKGMCFKHYYRQYRRDNPLVSSSYDLDLRIAMTNVRIRDNNTCQWYKCGKSFKETQINVHHIFPQVEYPELRLVEKYMICYCREHHKKWHKLRGDVYHNFV